MKPPPRTDTQSTTRPSGSRLGYDFHSAPKLALKLVEEGKISRTDYLVLVELLKFRTVFRVSCWTTKQTIAKALGITSKTVQRSYRHLESAGLISMHEIGPPGSKDPDEPANRTGWRIHFLFVDAIRTHASKSEGGDTNVPPSRDTNVPPSRDTNVPQFRKPSGLSLDGTELDDNNETQAGESLSSLDSSNQSPEPEKAPIADPPVLTEPPELPEAAVDQALLAVVIGRLIALSAGFKDQPTWSPETARGAILGWMRQVRCPLWWVHNAVANAQRRENPKRGTVAVEGPVYVFKTLENWSRGNGSPGEPPAPSKPKPPPPPPREQNKSPAEAPHGEHEEFPDPRPPGISWPEWFRLQSDPESAKRYDANPQAKLYAGWRVPGP